MSVPLIIAGTTYNFPVSGESPNWGADATDTIVAIVEVLNTLLSPGDILQTTFTIDNDITVAQNINGLLFDSGSTRAANISYAIYRTSTSTPAGNAETGMIKIIFDDDASVGEKWKITQDIDGSAGVSIAVSDDGQFNYRSTDIGATGYSGVIKFSAKTLAV